MDLCIRELRELGKLGDWGIRGDENFRIMELGYWGILGLGDLSLGDWEI